MSGERSHKALQKYILDVLHDVTGLTSGRLDAKTTFEDVALELSGYHEL